MELNSKNIKELDSIMGLSIFIVFLSHIGLGNLVPGGFGVTVIDSILYGSLLAYLLYESPYGEKVFSVLNKSMILTTSLIGLVFTFVFRDEFWRETFRYSFQAICMAPLILYIISVKESFIVRILFQNRFLIYIGKLSYSIYLFHWLAISVANYYFLKYGFAWQATVFILTGMFSLFSYYKVELPFVKLRKKFGSNI